MDFLHHQLKKQPSALSLEDLDAPRIGAFLKHLEHTRGAGTRTRNVRLAAIRSFFRYVAFLCPERSALIQRVLAMPNKRHGTREIEFLRPHEIAALLTSIPLRTWIDRRDRALLSVALQTGLRVSELVDLRRDDLTLTRGAHVRCRGKGRKERSTPLRKDVVRVLRDWVAESDGPPSTPLFPSIRGGRLSRDAVEDLLRKRVHVAARNCPSLASKRVSPHVLRHTAAMTLLQHGVDRSVIALWLGHESVETTQMYLHANMAIKEAALAKTANIKLPAGRYRPDDRLIAFLKEL